MTCEGVDDVVAWGRDSAVDADVDVAIDADVDADVGTDADVDVDADVDTDVDVDEEEGDVLLMMKELYTRAFTSTSLKGSRVISSTLPPLFLISVTVFTNGCSLLTYNRT